MPDSLKYIIQVVLIITIPFAIWIFIQSSTNIKNLENKNYLNDKTYQDLVQNSKTDKWFFFEENNNFIKEIEFSNFETCTNFMKSEILELGYKASNFVLEKRYCLNKETGKKYHF